MKRKKILCIASAGGHWIQLLRLLPAYEGHNIVFVSTDNGLCRCVEGHRFYTVPDANRNDIISLIRLCYSIFKIIINIRPQIIISTGAAPGYFAFLFGSIFHTRNIWIDSIANVDEISLTGKKVRKLASMWLTQWKHLARPNGPYYKGGII